MGQKKQVKQQYSKDFKLSAIKLVLEQGMSKAQVSKDLGLSNGTLGRWVEEFQADSNSSFPGQGNTSEQRKKILELEKENKQLKMERDILKKATAFFANHGK